MRRSLTSLLGMASAATFVFAQARAESPNSHGANSDKPVLVSPFRPMMSQASELPAISMQIDVAALSRLRGRREVLLTEFVLAPIQAGHPAPRVALDLHSIHVFGPETNIIDGAKSGSGQMLPRPDVMLFGGSIAGQPDTRVFLSIAPNVTCGFVQTPDQLHIMSNGPFGADHDLLIYDASRLPPGAIHWRDFVCESIATGGTPNLDPHASSFGLPVCRNIRVAIETDWEFTTECSGGDVMAAAAYVATLMGAASEIYTDQLNVRLDVTFVRVWSGPNDPWNVPTLVGQLLQFRDVWMDTMNHVERNIAHFLSGRSLGGGAAFQGGLCSTAGYGLSSNLNGSFPYPLQSHHQQNWDPVVVMHEIGHNLGALHTHDYCPPLDECAPKDFWGLCQTQTACSYYGTIMSYCHLCNGGMQNIIPQLHSGSVNAMVEFLNALPAEVCSLACPPQPVTVYVPADFPTIQHAVQAVVNNGEIMVSPGVYEEQINCGNKSVHLRSVAGPEVTTIQAPGIAVNLGTGDSSSLEGFTVRGATLHAIACSAGARSIIDCIIRDNTVGMAGGAGMLVIGSSVSVAHCTFDNNWSGAQPGGAMSIRSSASINECIFQNNTGAIYAFGGAQVQISRSQFKSNTGVGSGIRIQDATAIATNCLFAANDGFGSAVNIVQLWKPAAAIDMINCTIVGEPSTQPVIRNQGAQLSIQNSIIWGNTWAGISTSGNHITNITFSTLQLPYSGEGNLFGDPMLTNDFKLGYLSPCIDAGTNEVWPNTNATDLGGDPRIVDGNCNAMAVVDQGAYERPALLPTGECQADATSDGVVNVNDLLTVINGWGECCACPADVNRDETVNSIDLRAVLDDWGNCPLSLARMH